MQLYDAHTHLNQENLFPDWQTHLQAFIAAGGKGLVNIGANADYNQRGLAIAQKSAELFPACWVKAAIGFHPCDVEALGTEWEETLSQLKKEILTHREEVVAIGECGIDLHYDQVGTSLPLQKKVFKAQCELARSLKLPIVIHSRDAFEETLEILEPYPDLKIYFHCWGYTEKELQILLSLFPKLFVGFCGNVSYPKAEGLRASLKTLPKEKLLIETDAPYLAPQGFRGQVNTPEKVKVIGSFIAQFLEREEEQLWKQVEQNFWTLYQGKIN